MNENVDKKIEKNITEEMESSFLDYSMSVIVSRALPDVRDGLKPVHRRILYGMHMLGMFANTQFKKSARIVGDVMGKYHPHGDTSIYDAMVRMAQKFSYRYTLIDGHGNFGSIDGDGAAAQRYTEARMSKLSMEMLRDINKETVNFVSNYDGTEKEPEVLPSRFPNILVNGTTGIAVGMATNIPPHNLGETIDAAISILDYPDITTDELLKYIKGPDFPTAGIILGNSGIKKAYETGRGIIYIRAKAEIIVNKAGKQSIVITEIPYQTNKSNLVAKIASLVRDKVIDGITDLRDESNIDGIKIVIELRKDANANVILNNLYKQTALQTSFGINLLALVHGEPKVLSLKEILSNYLDHQREIVIRRTKFDLDKATKREHVLEGLKIALDNIEKVIKLLRAAKTDEIAKNELMKQFNLTEMQSDAILEMKLRRLTGLEREKIELELKDLLKTIEYLNSLLVSDEKIKEVIKQELIEIKEKYDDERKTLIDLSAVEYIEDESLIDVEQIMITLTNKGYIKRMPVDTYRIQNKGGVGIKGMTTNEEDFVEHMIVLSTHDNVLLFTSKGKVYRMKGYKVPEFGRQAKGLPIANLIPIEKDEYVRSIISLSDNDISENLVFITKNGLVKRTDIKEFDRIRETGKIAITLKDDDELLKVKKSKGNNHIVIASSNGRMVRFNEDEVRVMGRTASGVKGMEMTQGHCIDAGVAKKNQEVLVITENGYGKRTNIDEYRVTRRGGKGVKALNVTEKTGNIVAFRLVEENEDVILITNSGMIIRMPIDQISKMGRVTQGVRLIKLKENQFVTTAVNIMPDEE